MFTSLRNRLTLTATAIVVVAMLLFSAVNLVTARDGALQSLKHTLDNVASVNARLVAEWINTQKRIIDSAADQLDPSDPMKTLVQARTSGTFFTTYVGYPDRRFVADPKQQLPEGYDPTARGWYQLAVASADTVVTEPYADASSGRMVQTFARAIRRDGTLVAVTAADVYLDGVAQTIGSAQPSRHGFAMLISQEGVILAHADKSLWMKPLSSLDPGLDPARLRPAKEDDRFVELPIRSEMHFVRSEAIAGTPWMLVLASPRSDLLDGLTKRFIVGVVALIIIVLTVLIACRWMLGSMLARLSQVSEAMAQIGSGDADLTVRLPGGGGDEIAVIAESFNRFAEKLDHTIAGVRSASETIAIAADEINSGSQDLSQRTEGAAGRLQETASSVARLTQAVRENVDSAGASNRFAVQSADIAREGQQTMRSVMSTMNDINDASRRIGDIIGVIDSIAFQTNILALNAAVESARAGEMGRGFSVVASEVRALAQRSADAAREIKALISASVANAEQGSRLVEEAGQTMEKIVQSVTGVAATIAEVSQAAAEQLNGIDHVNTAVSTLEQMTQQNAALSEQSAAAAESLQQQSSRLLKLVSTFRLRESSIPVA